MTERLQSLGAAAIFLSVASWAIGLVSFAVSIGVIRLGLRPEEEELLARKIRRGLWLAALGFLALGVSLIAAAAFTG